MKETVPSTNSPLAWWLAIRPKTLTGAIAPVLVGLTSAYADGRRADGTFLMLPALLCLLFALLMQVNANFINDYLDFTRGIDNETRLGPKRACAEGWITPKAMRQGIALTTVLSAFTGLPLILYGGTAMLAVGIFCFVFSFLYTTTLARMGLGDLLVLVFFGLIPTLCTYYIQRHTVTFPLFCSSLACGIATDALLIVNNYRDRDTDRSVGKRTLAVRIGTRPTEVLYQIIGPTAVLLCMPIAWQHCPATFLLPCLYLLPHYKAGRRMSTIRQGSGLNEVLGVTARNIFLFSLLLSTEIILSTF
ncbi:MAG: 1,4-dihydroxy-2-naphthoate octaprenyltransferase [Clostridium sp.]|nr:1,4-dihydroxy-2-naphthoate octaprenyltransferase [Clostridium sp.]